MTSKILESPESNGVFKGGIAVAPVTDWKFYDTIYTERYMQRPQDNADGYAKSAVKQFDNFKDKRYFLIHGTADGTR